MKGTPGVTDPSTLCDKSTLCDHESAASSEQRSLQAFKQALAQPTDPPRARGSERAATRRAPQHPYSGGMRRRNALGRARPQLPGGRVRRAERPGAGGGRGARRERRPRPRGRHSRPGERARSRPLPARGCEQGGGNGVRSTRAVARIPIRHVGELAGSRQSARRSRSAMEGRSCVPLPRRTASAAPSSPSSHPDARAASAIATLRR